MIQILNMTELACAHLAASASLSASLSCNVYTGFGNEIKESPAIVCSSATAREDFPESGIYHVRTNIKVKEMAADTSTSSSLAANVFQSFQNSNTINNLMQSVSGYYVFDLLEPEYSNGQEQDAWVQTLSLDIVCSLT